MLGVHGVAPAPDLGFKVEHRALITGLLDPHRGAGLVVIGRGRSCQHRRDCRAERSIVKARRCALSPASSDRMSSAEKMTLEPSCSI
jgi:hypothetical protein